MNILGGDASDELGQRLLLAQAQLVRADALDLYQLIGEVGRKCNPGPFICLSGA
jgi:hypothetical protein